MNRNNNRIIRTITATTMTTTTKTIIIIISISEYVACEELHGEAASYHELNTKTVQHRKNTLTTTGHNTSYKSYTTNRSLNTTWPANIGTLLVWTHCTNPSPGVIRYKNARRDPTTS